MEPKLMAQLQELARLWGGFRASRVILTANNYRVFDLLTTPRSAAAVSKAIGTDPRATGVLLDAVASLGLLRKSGDRYRNAPLANTFLVQGRPAYQGDMLRHADMLWKSWSGLDEVVRTGRPNRSGGRDYDSFIRAMHNNAVLRAKAVVDAVAPRNAVRALDLGGGPGTYSMELARRGIIVTHFDLPEAIAIARTLVGEQKKKLIHFIAGDYHTDDIGFGYDLVLLSHIVHSLSVDDSLSLIRKAREALLPGGLVAIHEFLLEDDRAAPASGALFSVNMLVNTPAGRSYTAREMKGWLAKSGFRGIRAKALGETVVVTGRRT